ncbi:hypothetical protein [Saccharothrix xinjiangensis]|uniref:Aldo/keto reductase family protein n=1 Tax=Saccharothrix xinjiangensis TaxID=204798 RepID=A0ABV9Y6M8_9PSEU
MGPNALGRPAAPENARALLTPGTSSARHLEEDLASANLHLSEHDPTQLDTIG